MRPPTYLRTSLIGVTEPRLASRKLGLGNVSFPRLHAVLAGALFLSSIAPASALSQQAPSAEGSASVAGTVLDASCATVSGADVRLSHGDGSQSHTMMSEANGEFTFRKIPAGSYLVTVNAKGFAPFTSAEFAVAVLQAYEVPDVSLSIASASIEVTVRPAELIAAEQIRAEEKQRLVGFFPNFYTSYIYDAAPLTAKQKFSLATRGTFDPVAMLGISCAAGIEQATNAYAGYGQGAAGYSKRFAAKFADGRSSDLLTHAVFPALLHQDP